MANSQPRARASWSMTAGATPCPGGSFSSAPETSAGSPSRPFRFQAAPVQVLLRGQGRAGKAARLDQSGRFAPGNPALDELQLEEPGFPARYLQVGRAVWQCVRSRRVLPVQSVLAGSRTVSESVPGNAADCPAGAVPVLHPEPGLQLPADRRQTRRRRPRPARAGPRFPDQGRCQPVRGASRISVPARGRGRGHLHGGRLAASGIGHARTDSAGGVRLRGDRTVSGDWRQAPARVLGGHRWRSASGRERLALGSRSVSLSFDASVGRPAQDPLGLRRWTDQHADRSTAHLSASGPVHGDDEGLRRIRITGNHQPGADSPRLGLRRPESSARPAWFLPDDSRQVRPSEAGPAGTAATGPGFRCG